MKWDAVVFDLDNTLIRTEKIKQHFFAQLKAAGLDGITIATGYAEAMQGEHGKNTFSRERFSEVTGVALSLDGLQAGDLQVPGAIQSLLSCVNKNIPTYILTLGVHSWQEEKLHASGLWPNMEKRVELLTTTDNNLGKMNHLRELYKTHKKILLINDKPDETLTLLKHEPTLYAFVRRERHDERYKEQDFIDLNRHERVLHVADDLRLFIPNYT